MTTRELLQFFRDEIGSETAETVGWTTDEDFAPAVRETLRRLRVTTLDDADDEDAVAEARFVIWERVRKETVTYHQMASPDGVNSNLEQVYAHAAEMAGHAWMRTREYASGVDERRAP